MTSIANPDFKYYKTLEGTWKDDKGTCEAVLNSGAGIEIKNWRKPKAYFFHC